MTIATDKPSEKSPNITAGPGQSSQKKNSLQQALTNLKASADLEDINVYATGKVDIVLVTPTRIERGILSSFVLKVASV